MATKKKNNLLIIGVIILVVLFMAKDGFNFDSQAVSGFTDVKRGIVVSGDVITSGTPMVYTTTPVEVQLIVTTSSGDKAVAIHEEAPTTIVGLSTNVYETILIDQIQVQDTTKTYQINPGAGPQTFTGKYAINGGIDQDISGVQTINVVSCSVSAELCNNIDDDCDYVIDESLSQSCYTGPAGTEGVGTCKGGTQSCSTGSWGACAGQTTPSTDICNNGIDEDCNGVDLSSNTQADSNCNQIVDWDEINGAIGLWLSGDYSWTQINAAIAAWLS